MEHLHVRDPIRHVLLIRRDGGARHPLIHKVAISKKLSISLVFQIRKTVSYQFVLMIIPLNIGKYSSIRERCIKHF